MKVDIMGRTYKIIRQDSNAIGSGYSDWTPGTIFVAKSEKRDDSLDDLNKFDKSVLRHEIIHAFLDECGLMSSSEWARNEEMVDWFALQWHKINKVIINTEKLMEE